MVGSESNVKFENVLQIWDRSGRVLPFSVRRRSWSDRSVFVVRRVVVKKFPYGKVYGDFYRDGVVSKRHKNIVLACSGCYEWVSVPIVFSGEGKNIPEASSKVGVCPFDFSPCKSVDSCDDAMSLRLGLRPLPLHCPHAFDKETKVLSCVLFDDVLCSFRKSEKCDFMDRCFKCPQFKRFVREMDEEEQEFFDYVDKVRKNPQGYWDGEF
jgi:hypothetical protein